jgi:hypothetical protein
MAMPHANIQEVTFYSDQNGVRVTNCRAIMGSRTYSMANVSSVALHAIPPQLDLAVAMMILGILGALVLGVVALLAQNDNGPNFAPAVLSTLLGGIGLLWVLLSKTQYAVRITAAGGESNALISYDMDYIKGVVGALNEAIVHRG